MIAAGRTREALITEEIDANFLAASDGTGVMTAKHLGKRLRAVNSGVRGHDRLDELRSRYGQPLCEATREHDIDQQVRFSRGASGEGYFGFNAGHPREVQEAFSKAFGR
jgi:hypothetical protein